VDEPSSYLRRLWFDALVHSPMVLRHLVEAVGADRVMLGSDYPFDMGTDDPVGALTAAGLRPEDAAAIRGGTAAARGRDRRATSMRASGATATALSCRRPAISS